MNGLRTALNTLLAAPEFLALEDQLRDRSAFHVLGIESRELSHSRFLAWLLDPREAHGLGTRPLRTFLLMTTRLAEHPVELDAISLDELDLDAAMVTAEFTVDSGRRPDVLVSVDDRPVLLIEYKVDAQEGEGQTGDYAAWASAEASKTDGPLPILVFLCPDREDDTSPVAPFLHVTYDPYLAWLADLARVAAVDRTRWLLNEFVACLSQRDDVDSQGVLDLIERLEQKYPAALVAVRTATSSERRPFVSLLRRHDRAFGRLGVTLGRVASYGPSALIAEARRVVERTLTRSYWKFSGEGGLMGRFLPADEVIAETLGSRVRLNVSFGMKRPSQGRTRIVLGIFTRTSPEFRLDDARELAAHLCAHLRTALSNRLGDHPGRTPAAFSIRVDLPEILGLEDDTPDAAAAQRDQLEKKVRLLRDAEADLLAWTKGELAQRLEEWASSSE